MSFKVIYTDKSGKQAESGAFGSPALAASYARTVKAGRVVPCDVAAPQVQVQRCAAPDVVQAQRAQALTASLAERMAEAGLEAGSQARLLGASTSEALDAARAAAGQVQDDEADLFLCGLCGKRRPRPGLTTCWTCARRA